MRFTLVPNRYKYADKCNMYKSDSRTCTRDPGRYCGNFRGFEDDYKSR